MTYPEIVAELDLTHICLGGCGITIRSHRTGFIYLNVVHWQDRRVTRRGLFRFLLLVARRNREDDPGYLNDPKYDWLYVWIDHRAADDMGHRLGVRFPVEFSRYARSLVFWKAKWAGVPLSKHPAAYSWAKRAFDEF